MSNRSTETYSLSEDYIARRRREEDEWADLAAAIVLFAFKDLVEVLYRLIILPGERSSSVKSKAVKELEEKKSEILLFFKSAWYEALTAIDADSVIREAQEQAMAKALKHLERQAVKEVEREQNENGMGEFY